ncbi:Allergen Asp f 7 AltName: Allergen=Asp f 7 [Rhizoctonia solani AG-1 IB]|uniref:Rhizoctonia solani AG1-IB WGS project CAOJ00000000 data, isolate 7/3/14, contig 01256 n=1 Tax=Thanatephorus cucumeris (strain AG1-IB / isolate 7/3/14) TaxID=1108050 RepID=M5BJ63_THACB|nr:Allergen Asp f 7 AltName: Allergen=Asp f 7 [Rhizoctonia solani AG-1 IB]
MRSAQVFAVFAVLATSVSSMSIGHTNDQLAHRRHAASVHDSVIQARGARRGTPLETVPEVVKRDDAVPRRRKRGLNQRRCAPKTSSTGLPQPASTTSTPPTSSAAPSTTPEPEPTTSKAEPTTSQAEPTTSQAEPTTSSKAKYTKPSETPTKTSTSAKPTATNDDDSGSSSSGETHTGEATFYDPALGSCGITSTNQDLICAVSHLLYDGFDGYTGSDPNSNPICGKKIKATYNGNSVTCTVVDRCVGCKISDLDFSRGAFNHLADQSAGRLKGMTWNFA